MIKELKLYIPVIEMSNLWNGKIFVEMFQYIDHPLQ